MSAEMAVLVSLLAILWVGYRYRQSSANRIQRNPVNLGALYRWPPIDEYAFEVVGESQYQDALHKAATLPGDTLAELVPESNNRHDNNAVSVRVGGEVVGYLSREDSISFRH